MQINANRENDHIEYKSSWRDEWLKWVCGFANACGGTIYICVDDQGNIVGLDNVHKLLEDVPNKVVDGLGICPIVHMTDDPRGAYIEIVVEPQAFPVSYKGQYYMRVGATNQLLKGTALDTFLLSKQGQSWDNAPVLGFSMDDLDKGAMERFVKRARIFDRIPGRAQSEDPKALLSHLISCGMGTIRMQRRSFLRGSLRLLYLAAL